MPLSNYFVSHKNSVILYGTDINECDLNPMLCNGGRCRNTPGSYQCVCPSGFRFNAVTRMCEGMLQTTHLTVIKTILVFLITLMIIIMGNDLY